jgi:hypothetical protein
MRKTNSNAHVLKLEALDVEQRRQICDWLLTPGQTAKQTREKIRVEFGVEVGAGALDDFYQSYVAAYLIHKRRQAVGLALDVREEMEKAPGQFSQVTIDAIEQKAFALAQNPNCDPKELKALFSLVLKARDQSLVERRVALLEEEAHKAKQVLGDGKLSPEEKEQRIKAVFGIVA